MPLNYGTNLIPGDTYSVEQGGTVQVARAFNRSVAFIGGMDTSNGTATPGDIVEVDSVPDAATLFGQNSELYDQVDLAFSNGAVEVYALPVTETTATESFSSTSGGQLANVPFFNPDLHDDHSITVNSGAVDVNIVYVDGSPSPPGTADTINLDYITGQWTADTSDTYDFEYDHGDYSTSQIQKLVDQGARVTVALTENSGVLNDLISEAESAATNISFTTGLGGIQPFADPSSPATGSYSDGYDSERLAVVGSPYGFLDRAETDMTRVHGAVAGEIASLPLGVSATRNGLNGLEGLRTDLDPAGASDLVDQQVMPLIDYPPVKIIKDMTTSTTQKFERVYAMDVIDEVVQLSRDINEQYLGDQSVDINLSNHIRSHKNMLKGLTRNDPPLLNNKKDTPPYAVNGQFDANDDIDMSLGFEVVGVIDNIDVNISVGDVFHAEVR